MNFADKEKAAHAVADTVSKEFAECRVSTMSPTEKVLTCRVLLKRLDTAFNGLQCGANDKISNPLHWAILEYLESFRDQDGKSIAENM
jgi:hypothetical protein